MANISIRTREMEPFVRLIDKSIRKVEKMAVDVPKALEKELEQTGWSIITDWYAEYDRHLYDPAGSLLHAYKININEKTWGYEFSPDFMSNFKHHQKNKYVYHVAFELGYHGGSVGGEGTNYPGSGEPWWRYPTPKKATDERPAYSEWYKEATKSFSPKEKMEEEFDKTIESTIEKTKKELRQIVDDIKGTAFYRKSSSR